MLKNRKNNEKQEIDPKATIISSPEEDELKNKMIHKWPKIFIQKLICMSFLITGTMGLYEVEFYKVLLFSSKTNRIFIHSGILFSTLFVMISTYLDYYRSYIKKERINYNSAKTTTHSMIITMSIAGICFSIGLWPIWHWMTLPILFMWFWGVLVQIVLVFPPFVQKIIFGGTFIWFMHNYLQTFLFHPQIIV